MNKSVVLGGLKRLFGFSAVLAMALTVLVLSGCGHHCRCDRCNQHPASCSTCSTCGVSEATIPTTCTTCQTGTCSTCNTSSSYSGVGMAPSTLSEPIAQPQQTYAPPPAYSTGSNFSSTSTSLDRPGESRDLPLFSKSTAPVQVQQSPVTFASQPAPAAVILKDSAPQTGSGQVHNLEKGETIYALARKYNVKPKAILEANHFSDPNHLSVGTKVIIPAN